MSCHTHLFNNTSDLLKLRVSKLNLELKIDLLITDNNAFVIKSEVGVMKGNNVTKYKM